MIASALDSLLSRTPRPAAPGIHWLDTAAGRIRVRDTGGRGPVLVMTPDGPNVIEHHAEVIALLAARARVVCFDMPGFGFSAPSAHYDHSLEHGRDAVLAVLEALELREATLAFSCANGYYAIAAARQAPRRIRRLLLSQTPGFGAMYAWTTRIVPAPIRMPVVGQVLGRALRRRLAHGWYGIAVPTAPARERFRALAAQALADGACYCLAGVVQGLTRTGADGLYGVTQPVTLLWGDADRSHRHTRAESLLDVLPQAQIRHVHGCGHFPDLERPRQFVELALAEIAA